MGPGSARTRQTPVSPSGFPKPAAVWGKGSLGKGRAGCQPAAFTSLGPLSFSPGRWPPAGGPKCALCLSTPHAERPHGTAREHPDSLSPPAPHCRVRVSTRYSPVRPLSRRVSPLPRLPPQTPVASASTEPPHAWPRGPGTYFYLLPLQGPSPTPWPLSAFWAQTMSLDAPHPHLGVLARLKACTAAFRHQPFTEPLGACGRGLDSGFCTSQTERPPAPASTDSGRPREATLWGARGTQGLLREAPKESVNPAAG